MGNALVVDRNEVKAAILAVDTCNSLRDLPLELGRVRRHRSRASHLDEHNVPDPLWVVVQQLLKRAKLDTSISNARYT